MLLAVLLALAAAPLASPSLAAPIASRASRPPVFAWLCLERCGDDASAIASEVAQLNANADVFTGAAFEQFNLGPNSTLIANALSSVAPRLKLGQRHAMVSSFPYPPQFLEYMRSVFAEPQPFIDAVIAALLNSTLAITGVNIDWEPSDGAGHPKPAAADAESYAAFIDKLARAVHAAGPFEVTVAVATWSPIWNLTALGKTSADTIATMGTYTGNWIEWQQQLAEAVAAIPLSKLAVGLETTNAENKSLPFTNEQLVQRFDALSAANVKSVGIWRSPVPSEWLPFLRALSL